MSTQAATFQVQNKWPILTIHRLNHEKIAVTLAPEDKKTLNQSSAEHKLQILVKHVISIYNTKYRSENSNSISFEPIEFDKELWKPEEREGFQIHAYRQTIKKVSHVIDKFFNSMKAGIEEFSSTPNRVVFFTRTLQNITDLFAVATGTAWEVFSRYRDKEFPLTVARQSFDPNYFQISYHPLFGSAVSKEKKVLHGQENAIGKRLRIISKLTCPIKQLALDGIASKDLCDLLSSSRLVKMEGGIQLRAQLIPDQYPLILNYYSQLAHNSYNEDFSQSIHFPLLDEVQEVEKDLIPSLNQELMEEIWTAFKAPTHETALRFCPKRSHDFFNAISFKFVWKRKKLPKWKSLKSTAEVLMELEKIPELQEAKSLGLFKNFSKIIAEIRFCFACNKKSSPLVPLFSCFEGEIVVEKEKRHYFHIGGKWYFLNFDTLADLYEEFQNFLGEALLNETDAEHLSKHWQGKINKNKANEGKSQSQSSKMEEEEENQTEEMEEEQSTNKIFQQEKAVREDVEGEYNLLYKDDPHFIVADKAVPDGIEIADLIRIDPTSGKITLYQVKASFDQHTRDAADQLRNAAAFLFNLLHQGEDERQKYFKRLEDELKKNNRKAYEALKTKNLDLTQIFSSKNTKASDITFVYAFANTTGARDRIESELSLYKCLASDDIQDLCSNLPNKPDPEAVIEALKEGKFLHQSGRVSIKLLRCTFAKSLEKGSFYTDFVFNDWSNEEKTQLLKELAKMVGSQYKSAIPRFSILEASKKIKNRFGFSFKLCQITHKDAPDARPLFVKKIPDLTLDNPQVEYVTGSIIVAPDGSKLKLQPTWDEGLSPIHSLLGKIETHPIFKYEAESSAGDERAFFVQKLKEKIEQDLQFQKVLEELLVEGLSLRSGYDLTFSEVQIKFLKKFLQKTRDQGKTILKITKYIKERQVLTEKLDKAQSEEEKKFSEYFKGMKNAQKKNKLLEILSDQVVEKGKQTADALWKRYSSDQALLLQDYKKQREGIKDFVLKNVRISVSSDQALKEIYQCLDNHKQLQATLIQNLLAKGLFLKYYLECLNELTYPFELIELNLAVILFDQPAEVFKVEKEQIVPIHLKNSVEKIGIEKPTLFMRSMNGSSAFWRCTSPDYLMKTKSRTSSQDTSHDQPKSPSSNDTPSVNQSSTEQGQALPPPAFKNEGNNCWFHVGLQMLWAMGNSFYKTFDQTNSLKETLENEYEKQKKKYENDMEEFAKQSHQYSIDKQKYENHLKNLKKDETGKQGGDKFEKKGATPQKFLPSTASQIPTKPLQPTNPIPLFDALQSFSSALKLVDNNKGTLNISTTRDTPLTAAKTLQRELMQHYSGFKTPGLHYDAAEFLEYILEFLSSPFFEIETERNAKIKTQEQNVQQNSLPSKQQALEKKDVIGSSDEDMSSKETENSNISPLEASSIDKHPPHSQGHIRRLKYVNKERFYTLRLSIPSDESKIEAILEHNFRENSVNDPQRTVYMQDESTKEWCNISEYTEKKTVVNPLDPPEFIFAHILRFQEKTSNKDSTNNERESKFKEMVKTRAQKVLKENPSLSSKDAEDFAKIELQYENPLSYFDDPEQNKFIKIDKNIFLPETLSLDFTQVFSNKNQTNQDCTYDLYGTIMHSGSMKGGHYTACTRRGDQWYFADDIGSQIRPILPKTAYDHSKNGYIYFFKKKASQTSNMDL